MKISNDINNIPYMYPFKFLCKIHQYKFKSFQIV